MRSTDIDQIAASPERLGGASDPALESFWTAQGGRLVKNLLGTAGHVAMSDLGVRIVGERGSGKLQLARLIHAKSSRAEFGFHHLLCAKVASTSPDDTLFGREGVEGSTAADQSVPGVLESSAGGTLYLDQYQVLPEGTRFRLWRTMEMKHLRRTGGSQDVSINVRIITGITKNPAYTGDSQTRDAETARKISPICINIPPLRERIEDIEGLIYLFLNQFSEKNGKNVLGITSKALDYCRYYDWPGNIYELRNVMFHCATRTHGDVLDLADLPEYLRHNYSDQRTVPEGRYW